EIHARIVRLSNQIWDNRPPNMVEERDWSSLRTTAERLLSLLAAWGGTPAKPVIEALTLQQVRVRVSQAVLLNDTALAEGIAESWQFLTQLFDPRADVSNGIVIESMHLADLRGWLSQRLKDKHRVHEWIQFREIRQEMVKEGVGEILDEVRTGHVKLSEAQ